MQRPNPARTAMGDALRVVRRELEFQATLHAREVEEIHGHLSVAVRELHAVTAERDALLSMLLDMQVCATCSLEQTLCRRTCACAVHVAIPCLTFSNVFHGPSGHVCANRLRLDWHAPREAALERDGTCNGKYESSRGDPAEAAKADMVPASLLDTLSAPAAPTSQRRASFCSLR